MNLFKRGNKTNTTHHHHHHIVAFPADTHVNSYVGLNYPDVVNDAGFSLVLSKTARWQWNAWTEIWDEIYDLKKELGATLTTILVGDALDLNSHSNVQLITTNEADVLFNAASVFDEPRRHSEHFIVIRGTEAHTNPACALEEKLADDLGSDQDPDTGNHSWWAFTGVIGGVKINAKHHPSTAGFLPHTKNSAASREAMYTAMRFMNAGEDPPDIAVRAHVHYPADSGISYKPRTFYCRPWQITTAFGFRRGAGRLITPVGTLVLVIKNGYVEKVLDLHRKPPKAKLWTI